MSFKLTYATMFDPPEEMHERFEAALARRRRATLGATHALLHRRRRRATAATAPRDASPIDRRRRCSATSPSRDRDATSDARDAAAARRAFPRWRATPARRARARWCGASATSSRSASTRSPRRSRSRSARTAWRRWARRRRRPTSSRTTRTTSSATRGYDHALPDDPLAGCRVAQPQRACSPYGVWVVIAPFNFPLALAGGPVAAALVTGNTVVAEGRERHALGRPPARRLRARRRPAAGRVQLPLGPGARRRRGAGRAPAHSPASRSPARAPSACRSCAHAWPAAPIRARASPRWAARTPASSRRTRDLDRAAHGIVRSAFGMGGQKCSALVARSTSSATVADALLERARARRSARSASATRCGARTGWARSSTRRAYANYARYVDELRARRRADPRGRHASCATASSRAATTSRPTLAEAPLDASPVAARRCSCRS